MSRGEKRVADEHQKTLHQRLEEIRSGRASAGFFECLQQLGGADPREVFNVLAACSDHVKQRPTQTTDTPGVAENTWPAANPALGQWWFTPPSVRWLLSYVRQIASNLPQPCDETILLCLGTPTLARSAARYLPTFLLDADEDVVRRAPQSGIPLEAMAYDVADELPASLRSAARIIVLDPPWYRREMDRFLRRAVEAAMDGADLIMTLPSRFTRPGVESEKQALVNRLTTYGLTIRLFEVERLEFVVPRFEQRAFADLPDFDGVPWRRADVIHLQIPSPSKVLTQLKVSDEDPQEVLSYSRDARVFRVFLSRPRGSRARRSEHPHFRANEQYRSEISRRKVGPPEINLWTSERRGGHATDFEAARIVLSVWQEKDGTRAAAIRALERSSVDPHAAAEFVEAIDRELELFARFSFRSVRRVDRDIQARKLSILSGLATPETIGREYNSPSDTFRAEFQRDRDRILWSTSLRRLTNKTQLFPVERSDQLRQRLTHSLEVLQLATTIGDAFGLNRDLIEAGALAHDVGHTPFGHAGEYALDVLLQGINSGFGGFNHYEHGVDVVRYLEDAYQSQTGGFLPGLDLTPEVCECILKHTFCHIDEKWQRDRESVWKNTKHEGFIAKGNAHLEGQAIRLADKISYLVSDLEDGILLGAVRREDLLICRLFHYAPIDFSSGERSDLHADFIFQRRNILQVLMEDAILASEARVSRLRSAARARDLNTFTIDHSDEMRTAVGQVWKEIQQARLHLDARVHMANMRAARIVTELTLLFGLFPNLIDERFVRAYERLASSKYIEIYKKRGGPQNTIAPDLVSFLPIGSLIGEPPTRECSTYQLIQAKDYVASLTDAEAKHLHWKYIASYSDRT